MKEGRIRGRKIRPPPREDQEKRVETRRGRTASQAVRRMASGVSMSQDCDLWWWRLTAFISLGRKKAAEHSLEEQKAVRFGESEGGFYLRQSVQKRAERRRRDVRSNSNGCFGFETVCFSDGKIETLAGGSCSSDGAGERTGGVESSGTAVSSNG